MKLTSIEPIYREHHGFVWRVVRRFGVAETSVDDAVQEVFLVLHRRQSELSVSLADPRGLLFGIARKVAARVRSRESARLPRMMAPLERDLEQQMEVLEKGRVVQHALDAMDEERRMTFMLVDVEGMSVPAAADCLEVNLNTAYGRLRAARMLIDKAIARYRAGEERERHRGESYGS